MDVKGPDGKIIRFPDGTDPGKIDEVMSSIYSAKPATVAAPVKAPPASRSWLDVPSEAVANLIPSAAHFVGGLASAVAHPIQTVENAGYTIAGAARNAAQATLPKKAFDYLQSFEDDPTSIKRAVDTADAVGHVYKDRYGSAEGIKNTLATDPVGAAADASMAFTGAGGALARVAPRAGALARAAAGVTNPMSAIVPVASRVGGALEAAGGGIAKMMAPKTPAKIIAGALADQGTTAEQAAQMLADAKAKGVPLALVDTGDELRGLGAGLSRKPGDSRTIMRDAVISRQEGQTERVQDAISRDLGPVANTRTASEAMIKDAQAKAAPLYEKAYAAPPVSSPELEALISTPAGKQAITKAATIAANEGRDPKALGFEIDKDGNAVLNPVRPDLHAALADARTAHDAALDDLVKAKTNQLTGSKSNVEDARARSEETASNLADAQQALADAPASDAVATSRVYSPQTLDYVKRGLDDVIEAHRDPTTGRLNLDEGLRAINGVRAKFLNEVDRLNPDYAAAREAYAGPAKMSAALNKGAQIGTKDSETIQAETRDLTPAELDQYKLGVRSALSKMIEGRVDGADKVKALVGTPKKRAVLSELFGGDENFGQFMDTLGHEGKTSETYAKVNTGSATAGNLADDRAVEGMGGIAAKSFGRVVTGHGLVANSVLTVGDLIRYGRGEAAKRLRAQVAAGITETDPKVLTDLINKAIAERGNAIAADSPNGKPISRAAKVAAKSPGFLGSVQGSRAISDNGRGDADAGALGRLFISGVP